MRKGTTLGAFGAAVLATAVWAGTAAASQTGTATSTPKGQSYVANCGRSAPQGQARCFAVHRSRTVQPASAAATPSGYGPADLKAAYNLPDGGSGQTVAVVDAQDDPNAEADLSAYRAQYGLPACTTANGCFSKLNQNGQQGSYPAPDAGWSGRSRSIWTWSRRSARAATSRWWRPTRRPSPISVRQKTPRRPRPTS